MIALNFSRDNSKKHLPISGVRHNFPRTASQGQIEVLRFLSFLTAHKRADMLLGCPARETNEQRR